MLMQAKRRGAALARLQAMVSRSRFVLHWPVIRRCMLGLLLLVHGAVWACADPAGDAGARFGRPAVLSGGVLAGMHPATQGAHGAVPRGAVPQGEVAGHLAAVVTAQADHRCGHPQANAGAHQGSQPCAGQISACVGLCATVCLPAAAACPALPSGARGLPATARAEACPVRPGWVVTGRNVPPESPPPIV